MSRLKQLWKAWGPNPLDLLLRKAEKKEAKSFLIFWNRGLGDIALGLYAITVRIREKIPDAEITFLTRENLKDGFTLLGGCQVIVQKELKRGERFDPKNCGVDLSQYDVVIENPDPTHWVSWQLGRLTPKLHWQAEWDILWQKYGLDPSYRYVATHVQTETNYANWRDWPEERWSELFQRLEAQKDLKILLFGFGEKPHFELPNVIDLRGKTPLFDLLSIIKNRCEALIVPDSGISSMSYYLAESFPIKHISLWSETNMGILKQNVASPNPQLKHIPLVGPEKNLAALTAAEVEEALLNG